MEIEIELASTSQYYKSILLNICITFCTFAKLYLSLNNKFMSDIFISQRLILRVKYISYSW